MLACRRGRRRMLSRRRRERALRYRRVNVVRRRRSVGVLHGVEAMTEVECQRRDGSPSCYRAGVASEQSHSLLARWRWY